MTAAPNPVALTASVENYLKTIYGMDRGGAPATTVAIAEQLHLTPPSVSAMLRRLAERGLVNYEPYQGVTLTEEGRRAALRTIRRHRIIEAYLAKALNYPWDLVHGEAERLEHAASDQLIDHMASSLGEPTVDPHGAPIPTRDGTVDETIYQSLASVSVGKGARVLRVSDEDPAMLRYLDELGLRPGADVQVTARAPFEGPISIETGGIARSIGPGLAAHVLVTTSA